MSFITWEMAFPIGVIVLGLALAWGLLSYKSPGSTDDRMSEKARRAQYSDPRGSDQKQRDLRARLKD